MRWQPSAFGPPVEEPIAAVRNGEADAVLADKSYLVPIAEEDPDLRFVGEDVPLGGGVGMGLRQSDNELRAKFEGAPEHVINFFFLLAESIRANMAQLGYRSVEEMIGQTHRLDVHEAARVRT